MPISQNVQKHSNNYLRVFDHFVGLALKGLRNLIFYWVLIKRPKGYSGTKRRKEYNGTQDTKWSFCHFLLQISLFQVYGPISIIIRVISWSHFAFFIISGRFITNFIILFISFKFSFSHSRKHVHMLNIKCVSL